jgi:hypothetical protein
MMNKESYKLESKLLVDELKSGKITQAHFDYCHDNLDRKYCDVR